MTDRFVQVETGLPRSRLVDRARTVLALSRPCAVGHLTLLWLAVMETGCSGRLDDRSDIWIEDAAGWQGEPGAFASFIRAHHLTDGVITDWASKYALVDEARERNKQRMRRTRKAHGADTVRAQNGNVSDTPLLLSPLVVDKPTEAGPTEMLEGRVDHVVGLGPADEAVDVLADEFDEFTPDVVALLRSSRRPRAVLATLRMLVQEGTSRDHVGRAVRDMAANGEEFNAARFRGFLRSLKAPRAVVAGVVDPAGATADLERALAWAKARGGYKHIDAEAYRAEIPESIRKALGACGGIKAFETADEIGLRMLRKQFITEWSREASHATA